MSEPTTAQRIAEIAARAEKAAIAVLDSAEWRVAPIGDKWESEIIASAMTAFAESELRVERMECAKAVCVQCREDDLWEAAKLHEGVEITTRIPRWRHTAKGDTKYNVQCDAAAIWSLPKEEL